MKRSKKALSRARVIKQLDDLCRAAVMERDKVCQRCESRISSDGSPLQWSHVHSRRHLCIRWEMANSKALCKGCHFWWGNNPIEAVYWFSQKWPLRWEMVNELLRAGKPMKDANLRELLEEWTTPPSVIVREPIRDADIAF